MIELSCTGWTSGPVVDATRFWQRWRGIEAAPSGAGVLLRTRSVHTFGMRDRLGVVALSADRHVLAASWILPRRVVVVRSAVAYLELRNGRILPPVGEGLVIGPLAASLS